jgi:aldose 1-epimerase
MNLAVPPQGHTTASPGGSRISSSGWVTPGIVTVICLGLIGAAFERGRGNLTRLSSVVNPTTAIQQPITFRPGGQDPIRLSRSVTAIGRDPEFLSATLLPGRGMNVYQITAIIPGHGEVPLLFSPPLAEAVPVLTGEGADANGAASTKLGGALLMPWAQRLTGTPGASPDMLKTSWEGEPVTFPASTPGGSFSGQGLMLKRGADSVKTEVQPDGQSAQAIFHAGTFSGSLPSTVDVVVLVELSAHEVNLTVTARNTGKYPVPFGVGWQPMFVVPSGDRGNALLTIPSKTVVDVNRRTGLPTGKMVQVDDTPLDFSHVRGSKLNSGFNQTYTSLHSGVIADGPIAEIRDTAYNISLRVIPTSPNITNLHVMAPPDKPWISIGPNTNVDDPLGAEWKDPRDAGVENLQPGASLQWKVRLEIGLLTPPSLGSQ